VKQISGIITLKIVEEQPQEKKSGIKRGIKITLIVILVIFLLAIGGGLVYLNWIVKTPASTNSQKKYFEVKKDETTVQIADRLESKGFIKSGLVFSWYSRIKDKDLQIGIYEMPLNLKMDQVFDILSNGKTQVVKVTIPEGYRTEQIAQVLAKKKIADYDEFVKKAKQYEGKLFPDTYYLSPEYSIDKIIETMLDDYNERTNGLKVTDEDLIIASIVEKEADRDSQRPIIAGIYKKRLAVGMKLESNPTVIYVSDSDQIASLDNDEVAGFKFWQEPAHEYFSSKSLYNTYTAKGLPPKPICNPGLASIEATLNYTETNDLYFIVIDGQMYTAKTYADHQKNVEKYLN